MMSLNPFSKIYSHPQIYRTKRKTFIKGDCSTVLPFLQEYLAIRPFSKAQILLLNPIPLLKIENNLLSRMHQAKGET